jgi:hypothetical protein
MTDIEENDIVSLKCSLKGSYLSNFDMMRNQEICFMNLKEFMKGLEHIIYGAHPRKKR